VIKLSQAESVEDVRQARSLFEEYAAWLALDLCFQNFAEELDQLPGRYAPPRGRLLLAFEGDEREAIGCVALRELDQETCEMKRLYVRPCMRGKGLGRLLAETIIAEARSIGYRRMLLDTLPERMGEAGHMYRAMGFREIEPYYRNPTDGVLYMELKLD
jgi:ribosomal protein S18 acetylase RimI-like enzyme